MQNKRESLLACKGLFDLLIQLTLTKKPLCAQALGSASQGELVTRSVPDLYGDKYQQTMTK